MSPNYTIFIYLFPMLLLSKPGLGGCPPSNGHVLKGKTNTRERCCWYNQNTHWSVGKRNFKIHVARTSFDTNAYWMNTTATLDNPNEDYKETALLFWRGPWLRLFYNRYPPNPRSKIKHFALHCEPPWSQPPLGSPDIFLYFIYVVYFVYFIMCVFIY